MDEQCANITKIVMCICKLNSLWSSCYIDNCAERFFSERELTFTEFTFAICRRPSVCLSSVCLSSVTFVHPTQAIEIFGNVSTPFGTLAICDPSVKKITEIVDLWRNLCTSLLYFVVRVRCSSTESSRSLSHLLMSFLLVIENVR